MSEPANIPHSEAARIYDLLQRLEARVERIEARLGMDSEGAATWVGAGGVNQGGVAATEARAAEDESLEFRIGEFWFGQVGTVVLLLGLAFLISYPFPSFPPLLASVFGYVAVAGLFALAQYWKKTYLFLSRILFGGGMILLYFATLRLHFFSGHPVIPQKTIGLALLVAVLTINLYLAAKRQRPILATINLALCFLTALFSDSAHPAFLLIVLSCGVSVFFLKRYNWNAVALSSLAMALTTHLLWLFGNPVLGNPVHPVQEHHGNLMYLALYGLTYALANTLRDTKTYTRFFEIVLALANGWGIFLIGAINAFTFFRPQLSLLALMTAVFFMAASIANWRHDRGSLATSIYACFSFVALSGAIFSQFRSPDYFVWLGFQSLLVIITAIWFRSRIIVIANIAIYLCIYLAYLRLVPSYDLINLSYAVTALTSARILNWKRERLTLKTDLIRNIYLACAFFIVLYGLQHAIPASYVSLSWLGAALFYFAMSLLLKNIKYRWMAILTIFATVLHVFIIDMAKLEAGFRIILFLAVGIVLLLLSVFYTRYKRNLENKAQS